MPSPEQEIIYKTAKYRHNHSTAGKQRARSSLSGTDPKIQVKNGKAMEVTTSNHFFRLLSPTLCLGFSNEHLLFDLLNVARTWHKRYLNDDWYECMIQSAMKMWTNKI